MNIKPKYLIAAVLEKTKKPLSIKKLIIPKLKNGQVLVKIFYSGACRSQLMEIEGQRGKDNWLPHLLGHEGVGEVIDINKKVKKFKIGDKVILSWLKSDNKDSSKVFYKYKKRIINAGPVTTFSNFSIVSSNRIYSLPKKLDLKIAILYGCALPTGYGIIRNQLMPKKNHYVAVLGLGGVGLCALATLLALKVNNIIAIDINDKKLNIAKSLGVKKTINSKKSNIFKEIKKINPYGLDAVVECAGQTKTIEEGFKILNKHSGKLIFASHPPKNQKISFDPHELITGKQIIGSWGGSMNLNNGIDEIYNLFKNSRINLDLLIQKKYQLEDIDKMFADLKSGKVARPLIEMKH